MFTAKSSMNERLSIIILIQLLFLLSLNESSGVKHWNASELLPVSKDKFNYDLINANYIWPSCLELLSTGYHCTTVILQRHRSYNEHLLINYTHPVIVSCYPIIISSGIKRWDSVPITRYFAMAPKRITQHHCQYWRLPLTASSTSSAILELNIRKITGIPFAISVIKPFLEKTTWRLIENCTSVMRDILPTPDLRSWNATNVVKLSKVAVV